MTFLRSLLLLSAAAYGLASGCASPEPATSADASETAAPDSYDDGQSITPVRGVHDVMAAKLAHSQAILEGIALEDYEQIEINARDLSRLSDEAGWRIHTTMAYGMFSDEFGDIAKSLADHARDREMAGISRDYNRLTETCVRCHAYMRTEGLYRDHGGSLSRAH